MTTHTQTLSRSAAKAQAHRESHMYRQGRGWIVSTWDDAVGCHRVSGEETFQVARQSLADWRARRAAFLAGLEQ